MELEKIFLLDTNILITVKNSYYAFPICPGFWDSLIDYGSKTRILSIDKVKEEINKGRSDDELKDWVNRYLPATFFKSTRDEDVINLYREINNQVEDNLQYSSEAKSKFIAGADPWLISYAKAKSCVLLTHETYDALTKNKVKIPNIYKEIGVEVLNTYDMLKTLGIQFIYHSN